MSQHIYQKFRQAGNIQKVPVRSITIPGTSDISYFVSLQDIQNTFANAQYFELNGRSISFLPQHDGIRPQFIAFYPGEILDIITETPESNNNDSDIHCSARENVDFQTSQDPLLLSSLVSFDSPSVEQTTTTRVEKNEDIKRILELLSEAKLKDDKMVALQEKMAVQQEMMAAQQEMMLTLQRVTKEKEDKILALQHEAMEKDDRMLMMQRQALDRLTVIQKQATAILTQTYELHEYPIPRLFIILPKDPSKWDTSSIINDQFRLHFLCECGEHTKIFSGDNTEMSHHIHLAKHEGYDLRRPKEFFQKYGRYMLALLEIIKYGVTIAGFAVPALAAIRVPGIIDNAKDSLKTISQSDIDQSIKYLQALANNDSNDQNVDNRVVADSFTGREALEGADLRHLETFIKINDKDRVLGNLYRIVTQEGHVKWVCIDHYRLTYKEKVELAFATAVLVNGGSYKPHLGQVVVRLGSKIRASEFFKTLIKARLVDDLDVTLDWECSRGDLDMLENALKKTRVSILRLDLQRFRLSTGRKLLSTSAQYDVFLGIMELRTMRSIHIVLPQEFVKHSRFSLKKPSHLRNLSFEMTLQLIGQKEFRIFAEALKINSTLSVLDLQDNSIGEIGAKALSEALMTNSTLSTLCLQQNLIGDNGAQVLAESLAINSTLTTLNLQHNSIRGNGAYALSKAFKINSTLTTLDLGTNLIGDYGAQALSEALMINSTLTTLNLQHNLIGDYGAQELSESLKVNSTLTTLDLRYNSIGVSGAQALSEALMTNSSLTTLVLQYNLICDDGAQALSEALVINSTLTTLNLECNSIGVNGVEALSDALKINSTLTTLDLQRNLIGDYGAQALSESLVINSTLTTLNLECDAIGVYGAQALSEALKINSTLTTLVLQHNPIGDDGIQVLSEVLKINSTLTALEIQSNS